MTMGVMEILMKALAGLLTIFVFTCPYLTAQDRSPRFQLFAGYSFVGSGGSGPVLNGWDITAGWNLKRYSPAASGIVRYFSLTADLSGDYTPYTYIVPGTVFQSGPVWPLITKESGYYRLLVGQRFAFSEHKYVPFFQSLVGVSDWRMPTGAKARFTLGCGGGLDIVLGKHFAYRVIQADYITMVQAQRYSGWTNQVELRTGVVFRFGKSM